MGTFTTDGAEYDQPTVPAPYADKPGLAKCWRRGWHRGIYTNATSLKQYQKPGMQAAYAAGHAAARQQRREAGEQVTG